MMSKKIGMAMRIDRRSLLDKKNPVVLGSAAGSKQSRTRSKGYEVLQ